MLLADDEEELVSTLAERLEMRGMRADWAVNPEKACELLSQNRYDIAVLDVKLPGMSGYDLQRKMAAKAPEMKFIFMTGHGSPGGYTRKYAETDAAECLIKPVDIDKLIARIREITGHGQTRDNP